MLKIDDGAIFLLLFPESMILRTYRSSRQEVFCKNGVLRNSTKIRRKTPVSESFFNKVVGFRPATLLKRRLLHRRFPVNFVKFLRTPFCTEQLWWLLLNQFVLYFFMTRWPTKFHQRISIFSSTFANIFLTFKYDDQHAGA